MILTGVRVGDDPDAWHAVGFLVHDRPSSIWGLALVSADRDASVNAMGGACGPAKDGVQSGRRIATVRTREFGISVPVALMAA